MKLNTYGHVGVCTNVGVSYRFYQLKHQTFSFHLVVTLHRKKGSLPSE